MIKDSHEFRDPIHTFIKVDSNEREVINSKPFQRLRYIRQLATSYLVYPGANHTRFEHSLGVMELASRVYDVITDPTNVYTDIRNLMKEIQNTRILGYWRSAIRMAALCHDLRHLPFSHAAEKELLPTGWDHERMTRILIESDEMKICWEKLKLNPQDIVKLAIGKKGARDLTFSDWEIILSEVITGNAFGVDRIDYLLRDSLHTGVAYGKFDRHRLIDTLRILPPYMTKEEEQSNEPTLGIEEGGLHSAEALLLARYFMFSQVYFHRVRRIYDIHLKDFMVGCFKNNQFPVDIEGFLSLTDNEILTLMRQAYSRRNDGLHIHAKRIIERNHFKRFYERNPQDIIINPASVEYVYKAACDQFGEENVKCDEYDKGLGDIQFPVLLDDDRVVSSLIKSDTLKLIPPAKVGYVFINPDQFYEAKKWIKKNRNDIIMMEAI